MQSIPTVSGTTNLVDILDRVLDKGLVIAGDIRVSLANVELLTIRIRLLVCSVDKAEQIGLNWWKHDPNLTYRFPGDHAPQLANGEDRTESLRYTSRQVVLEPTAAAKKNAGRSKSKSKSKRSKK